MHTGKKTHRQGHIYMPTHTHMCSKKTESSQSENEKSLVFGQHLYGQHEYSDVDKVTGREEFFEC